MREAIAKYLEYLRSVRNSSPHTISNYGTDLGQFLAYLTPPGARLPALHAVSHSMIREFVGHLHNHGLEKSSIARKLAACDGTLLKTMVVQVTDEFTCTTMVSRRVPSHGSLRRCVRFSNTAS